MEAPRKLSAGDVKTKTSTSLKYMKSWKRSPAREDGFEYGGCEERIGSLQNLARHSAAHVQDAPSSSDSETFPLTPSITMSEGLALNNGLEKAQFPIVYHGALASTDKTSEPSQSRSQSPLSSSTVTKSEGETELFDLWSISEPRTHFSYTEDDKKSPTETRYAEKFLLNFTRDTASLNDETGKERSLSIDTSMLTQQITKYENITVFEITLPNSITSQIRSLWRTTGDVIRTIFQPEVASTYRRVEWLCDCGRLMYWDIRGISAHRAEDLAGFLSCPTSDPPADNGFALDHSHASTRGFYAPPTAYLPGRQTWGNETTSSTLNLNGSYTFSRANPSAPSISHVRFLELCVNTGKYERTLGEIDITDIQNDGELFAKIASIYRETRDRSSSMRTGLAKYLGQLWDNCRLRLRLQKPSSVIFRRFILDEGTRIALGKPELPPPREVSAERYQYKPCPLEPSEVPMPDHIFFHFFFQPAGHHRGKWIHRLPKKLKDSIFSDTDEFPVGWGIHIVESPDYYVISALVFLGLVVSGVLALLWAVLTKDVQGAFGIGSYFVTVQAACMATLYFKWSQE